MSEALKCLTRHPKQVSYIDRLAFFFWPSNTNDALGAAIHDDLLFLQRIER